MSVGFLGQRVVGRMTMTLRDSAWRPWRDQPAKMVHFLLILVFELILYQLFLVKHYTCDCYIQMFDQKGHTVAGYSDAGRALSALLTWCVDSLHLNLTTDQFFFTLLAIFLLSVAAFILTNSALTLKNAVSGKERILFTLAVLLSINSIFSVENMLFNAFAPYHALAMLLLALSVKVLVERSSLLAYGLIICAATLIYQGYLGLFAPVAAVFLMYRHADSLKKYLISLSFVAASCGFSILASVLYKRYLHRLIYLTGDVKGRDLFVTNPAKIWDNLSGILAAQKTIWIENCSLLPKYSLLIFLLASLAIFLAVNKDSPKPWRALLMLAAVVFSAFAMSFLPHVFSAALWIVPRTLNGISALPGIILLAALFRMHEPGGTSRRQIAILAAMAVSLLLTLSYTIRIVSDNIVTSRMDNENAKMISAEIVKQEKKTGVQVVKLAFVNDAQPKWCYDDTICYGNINVRAHVVAWAFPSLLRLNTGRAYEVTRMDDTVYAEQFKGRNWNYFSEDQVVVVKDTAYVAIF